MNAKTEDRVIELREYAREQAKLAGKSSEEWGKAFPNGQQAAYRSGMWYAYHDIEERLVGIEK